MYILTIVLFLAVIDNNVDANNEKDLKGKVAVVTGGAKGIGYAITENFLKAGVRNVTIVDINLQRGLFTEKTLNALYCDRVLFIHGDVTKDLEQVTNIIFRKFGYIDIFVNNAGILNEYDPVKTVDTNLLAPVLWSMKFFNIMRIDRGGFGGTIVNIASVFSYVRDPFAWTYKSTKFGLLGLSVGLGHEYNYLTSGVRVFAICPGFTDTDMTRQQMVLDEQVEIFNQYANVSVWQQPDAVGKAAVVLYKTATTGIAYTIEGGKLSVSPDSVTISANFLLDLLEKS